MCVRSPVLGISTLNQLTSHPRMGAFWEGFALEEVLRKCRATQEECFFWGTQSGAELDLLIHRGAKRLGFEFKYSDSPKLTASMHIAFADLKLDNLYVIYPGEGKFPMTEQITAFGLKTFIDNFIF